MICKIEKSNPTGGFRLYKNSQPHGLGTFCKLQLSWRLCFAVVGKFRSFLDHVTAAIADLGRIKDIFSRSFSRGFDNRGSRGGFGSRSSRSFNRNTRSERAASFRSCGRSGFDGGSCSCGSLGFGSYVLSFNVLFATAFAAVATIAAVVKRWRSIFFAIFAK